ncbi:hypothetical protein QTP70_018387 [Hemibagrus guttatus]|uniref:Uncharacterized protein n=1 Tax=Hemibagrus guttatus TaxID=175788 RepID=A0AAE0PR72_9TELE|nr:hypothetical protein QTP70_018387 [Hemibagrus guttatus]
MVSVKLWRTEKTPVQTTHTMFSTSLLLLLAAASYVHGEELTQPASMTVQPGQESLHPLQGFIFSYELYYSLDPTTCRKSSGVDWIHQYWWEYSLQ